MMFSNEEKTLRLTFWQATNGEQLVSLVVVLPWRFETETVYIETNTSLAGLRVIDALTMPLFQYLDLHTRECAKDGTLSIRQLLLRRPCFERQPVEELDIFLVASRPKLRNLRGPSRYRVSFLQPGWRKPKKEFREYVQDLPLPEIEGTDIAEYTITGRRQKLGTARVRDLAPIMLQAVAAEIRKSRTRTLRPRYDFHVHGGSNHRTWDGCRHAMMLMSSCSAVTVDTFLWAWLTAMEEVVQDIAEEVQRYPFQTYFS